MSNYSFTDRLMHRVALGSRSLRELTFDLERRHSGSNNLQVQDQQHVLISGLARAGTTMLLRCLASSNEFATQTYRDMPFPLAPGLWQKISFSRRKTATLSERAHGDGVDVGYDSEEAFEEVFWLTFAAESYLRDNSLTAHMVEKEICEAYATFVESVVAANPSTKRYLAKNNNNCLRLGSVREALPNAALLVPFRDPVQHALSLSRQHQRFKTQQIDDPFTRDYMAWLGHFEFGLDHKPFVFDAPPEGNPSDLGYWLDLWTKTYSGIAETVPKGTHFFNFEYFCQHPEDTMSKLFAVLKIKHPLPHEILAKVTPQPMRSTGFKLEDVALKKAYDLYDQLSAMAVNRNVR